MENNFNNCSFKLSVPAITETKEAYIVSFQVLGKIGEAPNWLMLVDLQMKDRLGHHLVSNNRRLFEIKGAASRHRVETLLKRNGQNCLFTRVELIAIFLDSHNKKQILIHYKMQQANKGILNGIQYTSATQAEMQSLKMAVDKQN